MKFPGVAAVAAASARFAVSGVNLGLFCTTPGVALARNLARKRAFEMLVTGDFIDAETALGYGLLNRVVPDEELDDAVTAYAHAVVKKGRHGGHRRLSRKTRPKVSRVIELEANARRLPSS